MPCGHWGMDEVCNNTQVTSACHKAWIICNWFLEHDIEFTVLKDLHSHQSQSSRAPLRWDGTVDLCHACTVDRSAATVSYCHVSTGQKSLRNEPFHEWWPTRAGRLQLICQICRHIKHEPMAHWMHVSAVLAVHLICISHMLICDDDDKFSISCRPSEKLVT